MENKTENTSTILSIKNIDDKTFLKPKINVIPLRNDDICTVSRAGVFRWVKIVPDEYNERR